MLANAFYIVPLDQQAIVRALRTGQYTVNANQAGATEMAPCPTRRRGCTSRCRSFDERDLSTTSATWASISESDGDHRSDQQRLNVDAIARWRIKDPLQFFRAAQSDGQRAPSSALRFNAALRGELGKVSQPDIISASVPPV
jgi:regulator of protease activity HflC (stomatin/prohibitin superfamily)